MKALVDTNVVLDVLLERRPHVADSVEILEAVESGDIRGLLGATTITTIHYLVAKALGVRRAAHHIQTILSIFEIAPVDMTVLRDALHLGFPDYEDAVLHEAARRAGAAVIVTRDGMGFRKAELTIYSPGELLAILKRK